MKSAIPANTVGYWERAARLLHAGNQLMYAIKAAQEDGELDVIPVLRGWQQELFDMGDRMVSKAIERGWKYV